MPYSNRSIIHTFTSLYYFYIYINIYTRAHIYEMHIIATLINDHLVVPKEINDHPKRNKP